MIGYRNTNTKPNVKERTIHFTTEQIQQLDKSLYGAFRRIIMASINQQMFACVYSQFGRPGFSVDILIGIMLLSAVLSVSEDRILEELPYNVAYQYALCMDTQESIQIPSKRTLIRFRTRCIVYNIMFGYDVFHTQCVLTVQNMAESLKIVAEYFRMDSTMLNLYAQKLSRSQLLYCAIQGVVIRLAETSKHELYESERKCQYKVSDVVHSPQKVKEEEVSHKFAEEKALKANIPYQLWHYLYPDDYNSRFYAHKNQKDITKELLLDAEILWSHYHTSKHADKHEFMLFLRVIKEQCEWVLCIDKNMSGESKQDESKQDESKQDGSKQDEKSNNSTSSNEKSALPKMQGYTGKRVMRFKLSKEEQKLEEAQRGKFFKLECDFNKLQKEYNKINTQYSNKIDELEKTKKKLLNVKDLNSQKYKNLDSKVNELNTKVQKLHTELLDKKTRLDEAEEKWNDEAQAIARQTSYIVVDEAMADAIGKMDSNILQSLLDPDATFCEKAKAFYRGYKLCAIEMTDGDGHSMPVDWVTLPNNSSDALAGTMLLLKMGIYKSAKKLFIIADGAFSGKEIENAAQKINAEIINTEMTGQKTKDHYADMEFNEDGNEILFCANKQKATTKQCNKDGTVTATVDASSCKNCKYYNECNPSISKNKATVKASIKQKIRAAQQRIKGSTQHRVFGRLRNGVEALMNLIKRKQVITRQPIYGKQRVSLSNDCTMVACGFSKYLAQVNIPHSKVIPQDYDTIFAESEDECEKEAKSIEKEFGSINMETYAKEAEALNNDSKDDNQKISSYVTVEYELMIVPQTREADVNEKKDDTNSTHIPQASTTEKVEETTVIFLVGPNGICIPTIVNEDAEIDWADILQNNECEEAPNEKEENSVKPINSEEQSINPPLNKNESEEATQYSKESCAISSQSKCEISNEITQAEEGNSENSSDNEYIATKATEYQESKEATQYSKESCAILSQSKGEISNEIAQAREDNGEDPLDNEHIATKATESQESEETTQYSKESCTIPAQSKDEISSNITQAGEDNGEGSSYNEHIVAKATESQESEEKTQYRKESCAVPAQSEDEISGEITQARENNSEDSSDYEHIVTKSKESQESEETTQYGKESCAIPAQPKDEISNETTQAEEGNCEGSPDNEHIVAKATETQESEDKESPSKIKKERPQTNNSGINKYYPRETKKPPLVKNKKPYRENNTCSGVLSEVSQRTRPRTRAILLHIDKKVDGKDVAFQ